MQASWASAPSLQEGKVWGIGEAQLQGRRRASGSKGAGGASGGGMPRSASNGFRVFLALVFDPAEGPEELNAGGPLRKLGEEAALSGGRPSPPPLSTSKLRPESSPELSVPLSVRRPLQPAGPRRPGRPRGPSPRRKHHNSQSETMQLKRSRDNERSWRAPMLPAPVPPPDDLARLALICCSWNASLQFQTILLFQPVARAEKRAHPDELPRFHR